jgi:hypothetical protein
MCGGYPAFPTDDDTRAQDRKIDLYAVIRGAQFSFHVAMGDLTENRVRFTVPVEAVEDAFVIGVVRTGELACKFYELDREGIEDVGTRKGETWEIDVTLADLAEDWAEITTFSKRL